MMAMIMTGKRGSLAYWDMVPAARSEQAFGPEGTFLQPLRLSFAKLSAFAANGNHAPAAFGAALDANAGLDLLYRIAGVR